MLNSIIYSLLYNSKLAFFSVEQTRHYLSKPSKNEGKNLALYLISVEAKIYQVKGYTHAAYLNYNSNSKAEGKLYIFFLCNTEVIFCECVRLLINSHYRYIATRITKSSKG